MTMTREQVVAEISQPIDMLDMETTLSRHVYLFHIATDELPELKQEVYRRKAVLDRISSEEFLRIKEVSAKEKTKITDKATEAAVQVSSRYVAAHDAWINARRALDDVERVVAMFHHRESALKRLVDLYQSQYWTLSGVGSKTAKTKAKPETKPETKPKYNMPGATGTARFKV